MSLLSDPKTVQSKETFVFSVSRREHCALGKQNFKKQLSCYYASVLYAIDNLPICSSFVICIR